MTALLVLAWLSAFAFVVSFCNAHIDFIYIRTYMRTIKHWSRGIVRIILFAACPWLPFMWIGFDWLKYASMTAFACAFFWYWFELLLNRLLEKPDYFIGTTAMSDRFFRWLFKKNPEESLHVLKAVTIALLAAFTSVVLL